MPPSDAGGGGSILPLADADATDHEADERYVYERVAVMPPCISARSSPVGAGIYQSEQKQKNRQREKPAAKAKIV